MIVLCLLFECSQLILLSRCVLEEKHKMEMHWLYKHGPYEITEAYTIICSCELSFLLLCCSIQSITLRLHCKRHLLKGTIQTALHRRTYCNIHIRQRCYMIIYECLYSAVFAQGFLLHLSYSYDPGFWKAI